MNYLTDAQLKRQQSAPNAERETGVGDLTKTDMVSNVVLSQRVFKDNSDWRQSFL